MEVILRLTHFLNALATTALVILVVFILLRVIANAVDLNPFGWASRSIRRLTDPLIMPVRRGLMGFGVDPKYAPFVTILLSILLWWFVSQLVTSLGNTIVGTLRSTASGDLAALIGYLLYGFLGLYSLLIFIRIIFSWGMVSYSNRVMRFLIKTTEPLLAPLRRMIPLVGMFDVSAIVAFIIIWLFQAAIAGTLLKGMPTSFL